MRAGELMWCDGNVWNDLGDHMGTNCINHDDQVPHLVVYTGIRDQKSSLKKNYYKVITQQGLGWVREDFLKAVE